MVERLRAIEEQDSPVLMLQSTTSKKGRTQLTPSLVHLKMNHI